MSDTVDAARVERAHAKLNLILRILARDSSGYHRIETLFQRLALHDTVRVDTRVTSRALHCDGPSMPKGGLGAPQENLAWKAAERFMQATGWDAGWEITIDKQIPVGGGLGGGSSDAAAVLRALNALAPTPLAAGRLLELARELGADVSFFVLNAVRAWGSGHGDRLFALDPLPVAQVALFAFSTGVNTGAAYSAFAHAREQSGQRAGERDYSTDELGDWSGVTQHASNDFDDVVSRLHPGVAQVLPMARDWADRLVRSGSPSIGALSGSGATCFVLSTATLGEMRSVIASKAPVSSEFRTLFTTTG